MIQDGIRSGRLHDAVTLIDATSGNTGIAYAMIAAEMGFNVRLAVPGNASEPRKRILTDYGAELIYTDPMDGTDGAREFVRAMVSENPELWFYPDQYSNDENWLAHYRTTGPEIYRQSDGRVSHFAAVLGTTGTFTGVSRWLKAQNPDIKTIAVQPDSALHGIEGVKHIESAEVPSIYDPGLVDETVVVRTEDALAMAVQLRDHEGLAVGPSSGANVVAARRIAEKNSSAVIVTILCDGSARYEEV